MPVELTETRITAQLTSNYAYEGLPASIEVYIDESHTMVVDVPESILVGEYIEKTICLEGYFIRDAEVYSCRMDMTAKNTESPDVFIMQLPEGAEKFIGANAYARNIYKKEKTSLEDIKQHRPTHIDTVSGWIKRVYAGRTGRK